MLFYISMPRRQLDQRNIRKLYKHSKGTTYLSIPKEVIDALKWRDGQKVVVKKNGSKVVIEDWKE